MAATAAASNSLLLPDPHYNSPGRIDTLIPPDNNLSADELADIETSKIQSEISCRVRSSLPRRKRIRVDNGEAYRHGLNRQELCWNVFQPYLEKCIPVKINNVAKFRHFSGESIPTDEPVFPILSVDSLPAEVLDKTITVQCVPNLKHEWVHPSDLDNDKNRQQPRDIDSKLSLLSHNTSGDYTNNTPIFMGQEDQVTTEMSLRELLTSDQLIEKQKLHNKLLSRSKCCITHYAAHHVSASQVPILDVDELDQEGSISLNIDGKVNHHQQAVTNLQLSPLLSLLTLPSYLLLGNPNNESQDITIQNINLWHAPQSCCTNVHYDDHDNLLIVTSGEKVVELCPPGCIQASGVYSTHANHPKLLRRCGDVREDEDIQRDIQATLERKDGRTHIVSVAVGEALYIPLGWWHRVFSKCNQSNGPNGCTAINVWFDYLHRDQNNVPKHMTVFQLRQCSRNYFEQNKDYATNSILEEKSLKFFLETTEILFPECLREESTTCRQDWKEMNKIVFGKEFDKPSVLSFGKIYFKRLSSTPRTRTRESPLPNDPFFFILEAFLRRIQLGNNSHVAGLVKMWTEVDIAAPHALFFSNVLRMLSPEVCFVLTQAWEKHAGVKTFVNNDVGEVDDEVELSYRCFFLSVVPYNNEVRDHLRNCVEEFYRQAWMKLSSAF